MSHLFITLICCLINVIASLRTSGRLDMRLPSLKPVSPTTPDIFFYNTLTRQKEKFVPMNPSKVSFYSCGPTVYDFAHIGNFRAFLTYDLIKRWLQYRGYNVDHICNLTDVDDKIIVKMNNDKMTLSEVTNKYANAFFDDLKVLNIRLANQYPKVTEYITDIENMIDILVQKGHAYSSNGSVYFRVNSLSHYSKLKNINIEEMIDGAGGAGPNTRRGVDDKEDSKDFVLWKSFLSQDGEVAWESKFGKGRPGWHIECSAMCCKLLGETIDIHAGGIDLVFPHHQNEIVQSEAYSGKIYSKYWLHNGFVNINNEKMSKSLKNFKTLRDIASSPFDARAFRYLVITSQYRSPLNFSPETFKAAIQSLKRVDKIVQKLKDVLTASPAAETKNDINSLFDYSLKFQATPLDTSSTSLSSDEQETLKFCETVLNNFEKAMDDDLNTPRATAELFSWITYTEKLFSSSSASASNISKRQAEILLEALQLMDEVFGIFYEVPSNYFSSNMIESLKQSLTANDVTMIPEEVIALANKRVEAKASKQFAESDRLRDEISSLGYVIKDKKDGYELIKK